MAESEEKRAVLGAGLFLVAGCPARSGFSLRFNWLLGAGSGFIAQPPDRFCPPPVRAGQVLVAIPNHCYTVVPKGVRGIEAEGTEHRA